jgi:hypothetical protein
MIAPSAWVPPAMLALVLGAIALRLAAAVHDSLMVQTLLHAAHRALG